MDKHELETKFTKALSCLEFIVGVLAQTKDGLGPREIDGLVFILTDILVVFEEVGGFVLGEEKIP